MSWRDGRECHFSCGLVVFAWIRRYSGGFFRLTLFLYQRADGIVAYVNIVRRYLLSEGVRPE